MVEYEEKTFQFYKQRSGKTLLRSEEVSFKERRQGTELHGELEEACFLQEEQYVQSLAA